MDSQILVSYEASYVYIILVYLCFNHENTVLAFSRQTDFFFFFAFPMNDVKIMRRKSCSNRFELQLWLITSFNGNASTIFWQKAFRETQKETQLAN